MDAPAPTLRIALSLSGGGFRAAAFHLGVLRLLHRVQLLERVRALSTASGGTIAGAFYAQCTARKVAFEAFDERLREYLVTHDVIDGALRRLGTQDDGRSHALITAAADDYAATLVDGSLGELAVAASHLDEISFNSTDIENGLPFRFVKTVTRHVRSGNRRYSIPDEVSRRLRLADIVAASSCFPAAFEPMTFPRDFALPADAKPTTAVPLMDGGIIDNQGVDALLLVRARRRKEIDLIIVSDADANAAPLFEERPVATLRMRVRTALAAVAALGGLSAGAAASLVPLLPASLAGVVLLAAVALACGWSIARVLGLSTLAIAGRRRPLLWRHLGSMRLGDLLRAAALRGDTLVALTARIFMKRVRALTYQRLFDHPSTASRTMGCLITDLGGDEAAPQAMRELAMRAAATPTTLWSDSASQMDELVAAGEMTACRALLRRIETEPATADDPLREALNREWAELRSLAERQGTSAAT